MTYDAEFGVYGCPECGLPMDGITKHPGCATNRLKREQTKIIDSDAMPCTLVGGLSKREYFAGLAMQGLLAERVFIQEAIAERAVKLADALLKALSPDGGAE